MICALLISAAVAGLEPAPATAVQESPNSAERYERLRTESELAGGRGDLETLRDHLLAIEQVLRGLTLPEQTACWRLLEGTVLVELGRRSEARALFSDLADTCPTWDTLNNFGVLEADLGRLPAAQRHFERALGAASSENERDLSRRNLDTLLSPGNVSLVFSGVSEACVSSSGLEASCPATGLERGPLALEMQLPPSTPEVVPPPAPPVVARPAVKDEGEGQRAIGPQAVAVESPLPSAESEIEEMLDRWARAWSEQRVEDFLSFYAPDFRPGPGTNHQEWRRERERKILDKKHIEIRIGELRVTPTGDGEASASFLQTYVSDTYCDSVEKTLRLRRLEVGWRIVESRTALLTRTECP